MVNGAQHSVTGPTKEDATGSTNANYLSEGTDLFDIVQFQKGNFVQNLRSPGNKCYHTILW